MTGSDEFSPVDNGQAVNNLAETGALTETQASATAEETLDAAASTSSIDSLF